MFNYTLNYSQKNEKSHFSFCFAFLRFRICPEISCYHYAKRCGRHCQRCRFHNTGLGDLYKTHNYKMENTFFDRLLIEAQELATKTNALNDFMRTQKFVDLDRQNKDLLYKQSRLMNEYLQILGQRIELLGEKFSFKQ